jgi:cyclopropane fatty-acyl-phospholipid synthase-like methyltransferase
MTTQLRRLAPESMLDIGTGAGTYAELFAREFPATRRIGVEVWEPYVATYGLTGKYDELILADARDLDPLPEADVVILGDVLEHMTTADAVKVWQRARQAARKAVYLSIPIIHYPQDAIEGNPHEIHVVDDYNHDSVMATFEGITSWWTGTIVGAYEAAR